MNESNARYGLLLLICIGIFVDAKLLLSVPQNLAVAGQRFTISCIFTNDVELTVVDISQNKSEVFTVVYAIQCIKNECRGKGNICVRNCSCSCSTELRNLSWIIESLPENWHNTEWKCMHSTGHESESNVYKFNITVPFTTIRISPDNKMVVNLGNRLLASCCTSPSRPAAKIAWFKEKNGKSSNITINATSVIISSGNDDKTISNSTLSFIPDKRDDGDKIFCASTDITGTEKKSKPIQIVVRCIPEENLTLSTPSAIYQGEDIQITCSIRGGNPKADISFYCGTVNSQYNNNNDTASRKITLLNISKDYNGVICSCSATHVALLSFKRERNITLQVYYPPDVAVTSNQEPKENSTSFRLHCVADGNPKDYTYDKWQHFYNGVLVREFIADSVLKFHHPLTFQDSGKYICRVHNAVVNRKKEKIQSNSTTVLVKAGPMFITAKQNVIIGEENNSLNIDVELVAFPSIIDTTWTNEDGTISNTTRLATVTVPCKVPMKFYGVSVLITEHGYRSWLNFTNFQSNDQRNYSLIVKNSIIQVSYNFRTKFLGPPDNPKSLHFDVVTANSIDLSWTAGENNGRNQSFNVTCKGGGIQLDVICVKEDVNKSVYNVSVNNLSPSTVYEVSLFAWNKKGRSPYVLIENITTKKSELYDTYYTSVAAIGGGCVIGMIFAVLLGIAAYRSKKGDYKDDDTEMDNMRVENEDDPDNGMIPFEPAEPYDNPLYAIINAPSGHKENTQNVSADQGNGDDANENLGAVGGVADEEHRELNENFLRNKRDHPLKATPSRRKDNDGLIYIDVATLCSENCQGKGVIHGIENRNDYAEVDFNIHADPLPSDDDDDDDEY